MIFIVLFFILVSKFVVLVYTLCDVLHTDEYTNPSSCIFGGVVSYLHFCHPFQPLRIIKPLPSLPFPSSVRNIIFGSDFAVLEFNFF